MNWRPTRLLRGRPYFGPRSVLKGGNSPWRARARVGIRIAVAAVLVTLAVRVLRRFEWDELSETLRSADIRFAALGVFLLLVALVPLTARWRTALAPAKVVPPTRLLGYLVSCYAVAMLIPGPSGDSLRVYLMARREGVPVSAGTAVLLIDKLSEGFGLVLLVAPLPLLLDLPPAVDWALAALCAGGTVVSVLAAVLARRMADGRLRGRWAQPFKMRPVLDAFARPARLARLAALGASAHVVQCAALYCFALSVGLHIPPTSGPLILVALGFATAVPLVPGNVGTLEAGAVGAIMLLGGTAESGLAFALVLHAAQFIVIPLGGASGFRFLRESRDAAVEAAAGGGEGGGGEGGGGEEDARDGGAGAREADALGSAVAGGDDDAVDGAATTTPSTPPRVDRPDGLL